jgi:hypothetical protein
MAKSLQIPCSARFCPGRVVDDSKLKSAFFESAESVIEGNF